MPTAETSTKVNYCNLKRSICDKAGAPFFLSRVCQRDMISPIHSGKEHQTASENYIKTMSSANEVEGYSCGIAEAAFSRQIKIGVFRFRQAPKFSRMSYKI